MRSILFRNSFALLLARIGTQIGTAAFTIVLARRLGITGFGEYALIAALIYVANSLTTFGTDMALIREIAAQDDLSSLPAALIIQLALSVLLIAAIWIWGELIPNQSLETVLALKIYILSLIPLAFFTVFTTALRGKQRMGAYAVLNLMAAGLQASAILLPGITLLTISIFLLAIQIVVAVVAGIVCSMVISNFRRAWHPLRLNPHRLLKLCAPLALLTLLGMVYQRLGIYLLSTMAGATTTGLFSAAARIVEASKTIHLGIFAALYPAMSQAQTDALNKSLWNVTFKLSWRILMAGAVTIALILYLMSTILVRALYGGQFIGSAAILQILGWAFIPFTVNSYLTLSCLAANQEWIVGRALAASLLGLLILNLWWIPLYGPQGSAWASLAAECIQSVIFLMSRKSVLQLKGAPREFSELS
jgi:O-antigen/teichoic acid export membrane protein